MLLLGFLRRWNGTFAQLALIIYFEVDFSSSLVIYQWFVSAEFIALLCDKSIYILHTDLKIGHPNGISRKYMLDELFSYLHFDHEENHDFSV